MQTTSYSLIIENWTTNSLPHFTLGSSLPILQHSALNQQITLQTVTGYIGHFVYTHHLGVNQYLGSDWLMDLRFVLQHIQSRTSTSQGPVVQSVVSLTSSLRVISLTVLADSIYNTLIFFAEKM